MQTTVAKKGKEMKSPVIKDSDINAMAVSVFKKLENGGCEYQHKLSVINKLIDLITERLCSEKETTEEC